MTDDALYEQMTAIAWGKSRDVEKHSYACGMFWMDVQAYMREEMGLTWGAATTEQKQRAVQMVGIVYAVTGMTQDELLATPSESSTPEGGEV